MLEVVRFPVFLLFRFRYNMKWWDFLLVLLGFFVFKYDVLGVLESIANVR